MIMIINGVSVDVVDIQIKIKDKSETGVLTKTREIIASNKDMLSEITGVYRRRDGYCSQTIKLTDMTPEIIDYRYIIPDKKI